MTSLFRARTLETDVFPKVGAFAPSGSASASKDGGAPEPSPPSVHFDTYCEADATQAANISIFKVAIAWMTMDNVLRRVGAELQAQSSNVADFIEVYADILGSCPPFEEKVEESVKKMEKEEEGEREEDQKRRRGDVKFEVDHLLEVRRRASAGILEVCFALLRNPRSRFELGMRMDLMYLLRWVEQGPSVPDTMHALLPVVLDCCALPTDRANFDADAAFRDEVCREVVVAWELLTASVLPYTPLDGAARAEIQRIIPDVRTALKEQGRAWGPDEDLFVTGDDKEDDEGARLLLSANAMSELFDTAAVLSFRGASKFARAADGRTQGWSPELMYECVWKNGFCRFAIPLRETVRQLVTVEPADVTEEILACTDLQKLLSPPTAESPDEPEGVTARRRAALYVRFNRVHDIGSLGEVTLDVLADAHTKLGPIVTASNGLPPPAGDKNTKKHSKPALSNPQQQAGASSSRRTPRVAFYASAMFKSPLLANVVHCIEAMRNTCFAACVHNTYWARDPDYEPQNADQVKPFTFFDSPFCKPMPADTNKNGAPTTADDDDAAASDSEAKMKELQEYRLRLLQLSLEAVGEAARMLQTCPFSAVLRVAGVQLEHALAPVTRLLREAVAGTRFVVDTIADPQPGGPVKHTPVTYIPNAVIDSAVDLAAGALTKVCAAKDASLRLFAPLEWQTAARLVDLAVNHGGVMTVEREQAAAWTARLLCAVAAPTDPRNPTTIDIRRGLFAASMGGEEGSDGGSRKSSKDDDVLWSRTSLSEWHLFCEHVTALVKTLITSVGPQVTPPMFPFLGGAPQVSALPTPVSFDHVQALPALLALGTLRSSSIDAMFSLVASANKEDGNTTTREDGENGSAAAAAAKPPGRLRAVNLHALVAKLAAHAAEHAVLPRNRDEDRVDDAGRLADDAAPYTVAAPITLSLERVRTAANRMRSEAISAWCDYVKFVLFEEGAAPAVAAMLPLASDDATTTAKDDEEDQALPPRHPVIDHMMRALDRARQPLAKQLAIVQAGMGRLSSTLAGWQYPGPAPTPPAAVAHLSRAAAVAAAAQKRGKVVRSDSGSQQHVDPPVAAASAAPKPAFSFSAAPVGASSQPAFSFAPPPPAAAAAGGAAAGTPAFSFSFAPPKTVAAAPAAAAADEEIELDWPELHDLRRLGLTMYGASLFAVKIQRFHVTETWPGWFDPLHWMLADGPAVLELANAVVQRFAAANVARRKSKEENEQDASGGDDDDADDDADDDGAWLKEPRLQLPGVRVSLKDPQNKANQPLGTVLLPVADTMYACAKTIWQCCEPNHFAGPSEAAEYFKFAAPSAVPAVYRAAEVTCHLPMLDSMPVPLDARQRVVEMLYCGTLDHLRLTRATINRIAFVAELVEETASARPQSATAELQELLEMKREQEAQSSRSKMRAPVRKQGRR